MLLGYKNIDIIWYDVENVNSLNLCDVQHVKGLRLDGNKIGDMGAEKLAGALPNLVKLEETWLDSFLCMEKKGHIVLHTFAQKRSHSFGCIRWGQWRGPLVPYAPLWPHEAHGNL